MKKITTFLSLALLVGSMSAQQLDQLEMGPTPSTLPTGNVIAPCSIDVDPDNAYGGAINATDYASKFSLPEDQVFQASEVSMIVGVYNDPGYDIDEGTEFEFSFYEDYGSIPAPTALTSVVNTPSSAEFLEEITLTDGSLVRLFQITVDVSGLDAIESVPGSGMDYFFGIGMTDDEGVQIGLNFSLSATGSITYYLDGGEWTVFNAADPDDLSFTYSLTGDCDVLSTNDFALSQITVYPNPTSTVFNVNLPADVEVISSSVVDIMGRITGASFANGQVNVSGLADGIYFLKLQTNKGEFSTKVIKQ